MTWLQDKCDADVAHWYAQKGPNYKALMNDVLRAHMEAEIADKKRCDKKSPGHCRGRKSAVIGG